MCQGQVAQKARFEPNAILEAFKEHFLQGGFPSGVLTVRAPLGRQNMALGKVFLFEVCSDTTGCLAHSKNEWQCWL